MNIKEQWINNFIELLVEGEPSINSKNSDYAYQVATAYFDWDHSVAEVPPQETVEQAYRRYKEASE